jgi:tetratricopeptide (TPR) repeat protein
MGTAVTDKLSESKFYYDQGHDHWRNGNIELAISCFEECVRIGHPYFKAAALVSLASLAGDVGDKQRQLSYQKEIAGLPDEDSRFVPSRTMGWALTATGEYDRAAEAYQRALHLGDTDPRLVLNFAELELIRQRYDAAAELLSRLEGLADPRVVLMSAALGVFLTALRGRDREVMRPLTKFLGTLQSSGLPSDLMWDFKEISPTLAKITEPNNSAIVGRMVDVLTRKISVQEFLKEFSGLLPEKQSS